MKLESQKIKNNVEISKLQSENTGMVPYDRYYLHQPVLSLPGPASPYCP